MKIEADGYQRLDSGGLKAALLFGALWFGMSALAEEPGQTARAVRLGFVEGQVQVSQGGQVLADPALPNSPLFEGVQVSTGDDGKAEIQFEDGSVARLSPNSGLTLAVLRQENGANETEVVLDRGLGFFEIQAAASERMRVRFGDSIATGSGFTVLRVNTDRAPGEVSVFSGNAHVARAGELQLDVHGGQSLALSPAAASAYNLTDSIEPDSWDAWNADRDRALQAGYDAQTGATKSLAPNENPAWADLDANGNWYNVPDQGYVWSPNDAASPGWDPYANGNWMWTPGFNYIWVSGEPWGFMPYQCGTWNYYSSFGWGWAPGMGSCQPWWGGRAGWVPRIGMRPVGYRFPKRPLPRPSPPRKPTETPRVIARVAPYPVIRVDRRPAGFVPIVPKSGPITINGHTVEALRPVVPRQPYGRPPVNGFVGRPAAPVPGLAPRTGPANTGNRLPYTPTPRPPQSQPGSPTRPSGGQPVFIPRPGGNPVPAPSRAPSMPAPRAPSAPTPAPRMPSGGGSVPHSMPAPAPAPHGGGGGPHR